MHFQTHSTRKQKFLNTSTPAYYINYFKVMAQWIKHGVDLNVSHVRKAMAYFAKIGDEGAVMKLITSKTQPTTSIKVRNQPVMSTCLEIQTALDVPREG